MSSTTDRRTRPRRNVNITATVVYDDGRARIDASVRNVSDNGARLELTSAHQLPEKFYMLMPEHQLQPCRIVWRTDGSLGLEFPPIA